VCANKDTEAMDNSGELLLGTSPKHKSLVSNIASKVHSGGHKAKEYVKEKLADPTYYVEDELDQLLDREEASLHSNPRMQTLRATKKQQQQQQEEEEEEEEEQQERSRTHEDDDESWNPFAPREHKFDERKRNDSSDEEDNHEHESIHDTINDEDLHHRSEPNKQDPVHWLSIRHAENNLALNPSRVIFPSIKKAQLLRISRLVAVNCLHKGDIENIKGKRWAIGIDGSESSHRALKATLKLMEPGDHLFLVTVISKTLPRRFALDDSEELQMRFELWRAAKSILRSFINELDTSGNLSPEQYTALMPMGWDVRKVLCKICKRNSIDVLVVGRHAKKEHNSQHWHLRSLCRYTLKHAGCRVDVL